MIKRDIIILLREKFDTQKTKVLFVKKSIFYTMFILRFPLKYQRNNNIITTSNLLLKLIKEMSICSLFKFKKKKINRYKFLKYKVFNYEI